MGKINWGKLIASIALCQGAGVVGSFFTVSSIPTWYATLAKPSFSPPGWVFGPVWILLYFMMGLSFYLILTKKTQNGAAIELFLIQLTLNTLWSIIFFGLKNPYWAFLEILFLWTAILLTIIYFYKISKFTAYLLIPYLLWVSFAVYLNFTIWRLNV